MGGNAQDSHGQEGCILGVLLEKLLQRTVQDADE